MRTPNYHRVWRDYAKSPQLENDISPMPRWGYYLTGIAHGVIIGIMIGAWYVSKSLG